MVAPITVAIFWCVGDTWGAWKPIESNGINKNVYYILYGNEKQITKKPGDV